MTAVAEFTWLPEYPVESPEWFAARSAGVTASDMQRLGRGSLAAFESVKAEKLAPGSGFPPTAYTRWGNEREPHVAAHLEFLFGIEHTNRICVNASDSRRLASPDGMGEGLLSEIKTTVRDFGDTVQDIPRHYYDQVQWAQHVTGIRETVFAWELNLDFTPGPIRHLVVPHDEARVAELVEVFEDFWAYWHTEQEHGEWDALVAEYAVAEASVVEATTLLDGVKQRIRDRADGRDVLAKTPFGSLSLALPRPRETFDTTAFKAADPDTYRKYLKSTAPSQQTLRVTTGGKR